MGRDENASKCVGDTHLDISLPIRLFQRCERNFDHPMSDPFACAYRRLRNAPLNKPRVRIINYDLTILVSVNPVLLGILCSEVSLPNQGFKH